MGHSAIIDFNNGTIQMIASGTAPVGPIRAIITAAGVSASWSMLVGNVRENNSVTINRNNGAFTWDFSSEEEPEVGICRKGTASRF